MGHESETLDVVVVGAGLCGLSLARTLHARGLAVQVLKARPRLGGRVNTQHCPHSGQALDLGPAWFWPDTEPLVHTLLAELGLPSHPQHDPGDALWLTDPNRQPERRTAPSSAIHGGAHRICGGTAQLVNALVAPLPPGVVHTGTAVQRLRDAGPFIEIHTTQGPPRRARQVVLALPPRLIHEHIRFEPALPAALWNALADTPTWMAAQAKVVTTFGRAFWREAGHSGNAFVRHAQAVLGEVFDASPQASDAAAMPGALGGFVALNAAQRTHFQRGLPLLVDSQLAQLYGHEAQHGHQTMVDWATEPWTCSEADRLSDPLPPQADPLLRQPWWAGRLFLAGSETATHGAGHMEGALATAQRVARALVPTAATASTAAPASTATRPADAMLAFVRRVEALRQAAPQRYRLHLARLLSQQAINPTTQLTQRALLACADQTYSEALAALDTLLPALGAAHADVTQGRHALTPALLAPFEGWNKALLEAALALNRDTAALSNLPTEQHPDADLLRAIALDLAAAWREFALDTNVRLLAAAQPTSTSTVTVTEATP